MDVFIAKKKDTKMKIDKDFFLDEVKIYVKAGDGGDGCLSFRREKNIARGGPDGGDGGDGGSIILMVDTNLSTLSSFYHRKHFFAQNGTQGKGKNQTGEKGEDLIIKVPRGTIVRDESGNLLADLKKENDLFIAAQGGKGGRGNSYFKSSLNRAPRKTEPGEKGEEKWLKLEMKLIADAGIIGEPNAGKSTLLSQISSAHPEIAPYPFTTLRPYLGIVKFDEERTFVAADIPGLIEGASKGKGLGDRFLRHIERSRVLLHLVDIGTPYPEEPIVRFQKVNEELGFYSSSLSEKPQIVVANKIDLPGAKERFLSFQKALKSKYPLIAISALKKEGLRKLIKLTFNLLSKTGPSP